MKTTAAKKVQPGYEPIAGYVLEKLIGRGGYGEVWQAEAPGGLKKAVKFVFGQQDERRAQQELKSLERIKGVQHPFILTLERFESIDGQLVIVTELADGSLEDIYKQHQERGSCGIPRAALMAYLKDTADALDYLHQLYKLQHLDIKPANLLIVGGHVKVADFGLLKDLGDTDCSLVGGLTPIYAPPEVFDGRPSMHSDQYSLAVMYQELLTGTRPFTGRTIAQLATQHVHNAPNLEPLPACDRPIIARALEKSPERRFGSCTEFVSKLLNPRGKSESKRLDDSASQKQPELRQHVVENLPQLQAAAGLKRNLSTRNALVIALGGTGGDVLKALRQRITPLRSASPVMIHSVLVDIDRMAIRTAKMFEPTECMPACRAIATPLRSAHEYRNRGTEHLRTVSRRWIYNIPRNEVTGGMRPLGRLALVDHGTEVTDALRGAIEELKECSGENELSVYVVGSLAGGTGSGMYIDVVHLLRHLLDEAGLEQHRVISLLTTNRLQGDPHRLLSLHGTKAALQEMQYFMQPGNGYPGDSGANWPSVPAARTPLRDAYLFAESEVVGAPTPVEMVTDYLWADATSCGNLLAAGRLSSDDDSQAGMVDIPQIRSAGLVQIGEANRLHASVLAQPTARLMLLRWLGTPKEAALRARDVVQRVSRRCHLEEDAWIQRTLRWFGKDRNQRRIALMQHFKGIPRKQLSDIEKCKVETMRWLHSTVDSDASLIVVQSIVRTIQHELQLRLQERRLDLTTTIEAVEQLRALVESTGRKLLESAEQHSDQGDVAQGRSLSSLGHLRSACDRGEMLMESIACRLAAKTSELLASELAFLWTFLSDGATKIALAIKRLSEGQSQTNNPWNDVDQQTQKQFGPLMAELHNATNANLLTRMVGPDVDSITAERIVSHTTAAALDLISELFSGGFDEGARDGFHGSEIGQTTQPGSDSQSMAETATLTQSGSESLNVTGTLSLQRRESNSPPPSLAIPDAVAAARPALLRCGGKQRLFLVCGTESDLVQLEPEVQESHKGSLTTFVTRSASTMLIHEAQQISLDSVLDLLGSLSGDDGRISGRLVSRTDVDF